MIDRHQLSWIVHIDADVDPQDIIKAVEACFKENGVIVESNSDADLGIAFDVIGINGDGEPWEGTVTGATEDDARSRIPEDVTIAKVQPVSIFAADPTGGS